MSNNFEDVVDFWIENGLESEFQTENKFSEDTRLRLDCEFADAAGLSDKQVAHMLMQFAENDLVDLALNGDTSNTDDALYKAADGAAKRGKWVDYIEVTAAQVFPEYKAKKKSTEYTTYLRVRFTFKDPVVVDETRIQL